MADKSVFDSLPSQISKDMQGSDNSIPLSPQWLLPKPEENKAGFNAGENLSSPYPSDSSHSDCFKASRGGEEIPVMTKKKDVFRPSVLDMESGRRDRWRDEERETSSYVRKDRWRGEGDRELGDNRKLDRWTESSGKYLGDARRGSSERWSDSNNKDVNYEHRRESKWNTRWGPDDREIDGAREKWIESSKDVDISYDKGLAHISRHSRDEEGESYRPWRSSLSHSRGKVEPPHQTQTGNKHIPTFSHGRGRGENSYPTFSLGRGKTSFGMGTVDNITSPPVSGSFLHKDDGGHGEPFSLRYSRTKLLDVFRLIDINSSKFIDGVVHVASITQEEPLEPLAFCAPTHEELGVFKGIDEGDIIGSSAPQMTKDGSIGKNSTDHLQQRRSKIGSREDLQASADFIKDETSDNSKGGFSRYSEGASNEKQMYMHGPTAKIESLLGHMAISDPVLSHEAMREDAVSYKRNDNASVNRDSSMQGNSSAHPDGMWRSTSFSERNPSASRDWRDVPSDVRSKTPDVAWSQIRKDLNSEWDKGVADSSYSKDGPKWQSVDDPAIRRQHSFTVDREQGVPKFVPQSPEDMLLFYKDPQGEIQGPFAGSDIIGWFEAGYFGIDLLVRHANASHDSPFLLLGDVMPHLRAKACPPPGFGAPKHNEIPEVPSRSNFSNFGKHHMGSSDIDAVRNETRYNHNSTTEAENRFLESLMGGTINSSTLEKFSPSQGVHGYLGNNSGIMPSETGDNPYLRAQQMTLERQRSLPNRYAYWPGMDTPVVPMPDNIRDSSVPQSKSMPSIADNSLQQPLSQNVDLLSVLQGLPNKSAPGVSNGAIGWSNFSAQGGLGPQLDQLERHQAQNFPSQLPFGIHQPMLQTKNQSTLTDLLAQAIDNPSSNLTLETQLSSGHAQDKQLLNLLQQQHLLQMQNQNPVHLQQLSALKLLLLKQQKEQEEQLLLRQKQQLLSQVLSEHQSQQHLGEMSYGQFQGGCLPASNALTPRPEIQQAQDLLKISCQKLAPSIQDDAVTNAANFPLLVSNDVIDNCSGNLPHQLFGDVPQQKAWPATLSEQIDVQPKSSCVEVPVVLPPEVTNKDFMELPLQKILMSDESISVSTDEVALNFMETDHQGTFTPFTKSDNDGSSTKHEIGMNFLPDAVAEEGHVESEEYIKSSVTKDVKNVEPRQGKKEKKSKKLKSSKAILSSDQAKSASKAQQPKQSEVEGTDIGERSESEIPGVTGEELHEAYLQERKSNSDIVKTQSVDLHQGKTTATNFEAGQVGPVEQPNPQSSTSQRAWKPAPGFKPKSLLEIQQEEQRRARENLALSAISMPPTSISSSTPWTGLVSNSDVKKSKEIQPDASKIELNIGGSGSSNQKSKKSQLHDLLVEEPSAKSSKREVDVTEALLNSNSMIVTSSQPYAEDHDNFIDAKETKKSRKKSAKAKGTGTNISSAVASAIVSVSSSPVERARQFQQVQQEKEVLPAVPSGPSFGDFVVWKGESPSPAPAWSADSGKQSKPTASLRDILKEQERKVSSGQNQITMPIQKPLSTQPGRNSSTWSFSATPPSKASLPLKSSSQASSQSKYKPDDDLFWGPLDQVKIEEKPSDFPHLANHASVGNKSTSAKGTSGGSLSRQKSAGGKSAPLSSSPASSQASVKGKNAALSKQSEAMDFRDWCENECIRLIGTKDTSFLEFCLKQSRSEAEMLLIENLGQYDRNHQFIEKFLNYKDLLPSEVLDIAFQSWNDQKVTTFGAGDVISDYVSKGSGDHGDTSSITDGSAKGGKKKGKKGKKVSPSALGFNVVSNRIMMGEIQSVED